LTCNYHIWPDGWGPDWDVDEPNEKRNVGILAVAKRDRESSFEVFNELVAMRLGQMIGLPIPTGVVLEHEGNHYFCSLRIAADGNELPPANLEKFACEREEDSCGVMVFDAWIANTDRHNENLAYDYYANDYSIFDHGRGILGTSGRSHLLSNRDRLGVRVDSDCLADHFRSFGWFSRWYDRICEIPDPAIERIVKEASTVGVENELASECVTWLLDRRRRLPELFRKHEDLFPRMERNLFDPFGDDDDHTPEYHI